MNKRTINTILRSNNEFNTLGPFEPIFDEIFVEKYGFYTPKNKHRISYSLKYGSPLSFARLKGTILLT